MSIPAFRLRLWLIALGLVAAVLAPGLALADTTNAFPDTRFTFNGLTLPAVDPALAFVAPTPDQPDYDSRLQVFVQASVPDVWKGQPVQFSSSYTDALGLPTSAPAADPNNPHFVYQRFQNGILMYNATAGTTQPLPLGAFAPEAP